VVQADPPRVALYTAIWGGYETPKPLPDGLTCHAYLFSDSVVTAFKAAAYGWCAKVMSDHYFPEEHLSTHGDPEIVVPMLNHKWFKMHPGEVLPDYDVSLWIDGSMELIVDDYAERCLAALGDDDWSCVPHPARSCIYPEADYSATLTWRYDADSILAQKAHYEQFHPPGAGLIATGAMARRHTPEVLELSRLWWDECVNWSHQDQLSLPVLLRLWEDKVRWNSRMTWHQDWILHEHG